MRFFSAHLIIFLSIALTLAAPITESHRSRDLGHANAESLALVKRVLGDDDPIPSGSGSGWKNRLGAVVRLGRGKQGVQQLPNDPNTSTNNPITGGVNTTPTPFTVPPPTGPPAAGPLTINVNPAVLAAGNAARNNRIRPNSPTSAVAGSPNVDKPLPPLPRPILRVANPVVLVLEVLLLLKATPRLPAVAVGQPRTLVGAKVGRRVEEARVQSAVAELREEVDRCARSAATGLREGLAQLLPPGQDHALVLLLATAPSGALVHPLRPAVLNPDGYLVQPRQDVPPGPEAQPGEPTHVLVPRGTPTLEPPPALGAPPKAPKHEPPPALHHQPAKPTTTSPSQGVPPVREENNKGG
ncbi:hypothetical protein M408DRAFT_6668 [Serendipita vermifera MAFF 305830]|uniref:Uncharacterized protein n=1 Tax=Serendipita vermifera MAFF 305830 TaxID=933852 RepID=A0A0C3BM08_SERVB|nr:hypothetical protein M408DRAFT_6668 [Serendipita vermifera MAFF 305830]